MKSRFGLPFIIACVLHVVLAIVFIVGIDFKKEPTPPPSGSAINAVVIDQATVDAQVSKIKQKEAQKRRDEAERIAAANEELERVKELAEQERERQLAEQKKVEQLEVERKNKEAERTAAEEAAKVAAAALAAKEAERKLAEEAAQQADRVRQQKEAERKEAEQKALQAEQARKEKEAQRVAAEQAAAKAAAEQKAAEEAAKKAEAEKQKKLEETKKAEAEKKAAEEAAKKAEAEKKRQQEEAKKAKEQAEREAAERKRKAAEAKRQSELEALMAAEFAAEQSNALTSRQISEKGKYMALIKDKVERNWRVESGWKGKYCLLNIRLANNGLVLETKRVEGDGQVCRSAIAAVRQANSLPVPKDPAVLAEFKDFNLRLEP
ncbi:cell envelope integrity protein TolA [Motilimonas sp. 1_MG-2023]|uniref:cell envelope integrity protein TolA n=1 Tax=Motilimonas TaxID=1914248 RepID=UPI001E5D53AF|nr:cell envelope integrity protein TolA [Motilimonas sp. 1_MG-2023]MCE0556121.1 cell envelope integrity protein TolA [Motilimonas sp. E26]MDO6527585.1 cell envelope integrity protein TolA [Motilimonas sp. 1_MG-2023]